MFFPRLFARQTIDQWVNNGSKMTHEVAHERVLEILDGAGPVELPPGADEELERALLQAV
jgi:trimethylamine:corrinoid methyltransferase-like protein